MAELPRLVGHIDARGAARELSNGALEPAEQISLGGGLDAVHDKARKPYILRRGSKFNIPLDARAPRDEETKPKSSTRRITGRSVKGLSR